MTAARGSPVGTAGTSTRPSPSRVPPVRRLTTSAEPRPARASGRPSRCVTDRAQARSGRSTARRPPSRRRSQTRSRRRARRPTPGGGRERGRPGGGARRGGARRPARATARGSQGAPAPAGVAVTTVQRPATAGERARASVGHAGAPTRRPASEAPTALGGTLVGRIGCVHTELSAALDGTGWRRPSSKASMADSAREVTGRQQSCRLPRQLGHQRVLGAAHRPALTRVARSSPCSSRRRRHGRALASATWRATATVCSASDRHRSSPAPAGTRLPRTRGAPGAPATGATRAAAQHVGVDRREQPLGAGDLGRLRSKAARPSSNSPSSSASVRAAAAVASPRRANSRGRRPRRPGSTRSGSARRRLPAGRSRCAREERR